MARVSCWLRPLLSAAVGGAGLGSQVGVVVRLASSARLKTRLRSMFSVYGSAAFLVTSVRGTNEPAVMPLIHSPATKQNEESMLYGL